LNKYFEREEILPPYTFQKLKEIRNSYNEIANSELVLGKNSIKFLDEFNLYDTLSFLN